MKQQGEEAGVVNGQDKKANAVDVRNLMDGFISEFETVLQDGVHNVVTRDYSSSAVWCGGVVDVVETYFGFDRRICK